MTDDTFENASRVEPKGDASPTSRAARTYKEQPSRPSLLHLTLWWFAGVVQDVMSGPGCKSDWGRYAAQGTMVLLVTLVAGLGMMLVAYDFLVPGVLPAAVALGLVWAVCILSLDRLLLKTIVKAPDITGWLIAMMAAPRVMIAFLMSIAVAMPVELIIFSHQLDLQQAHAREEELAKKTAEMDGRFAELPQLRAELQRLADDTAQARATWKTAFDAAMCEGEGTCGSHRAGTDVLYDEKLAHEQELNRLAEDTAARNQTRAREIDARVRELTAARAIDLKAFDAVASAPADLSTRLRAMARLQADPEQGGMVRNVSLLVRLLSLAFELSPLAAKLVRRGPYEAALYAVQTIECARWDAARHNGVCTAQTEVDQHKALEDTALATSAELSQQAAKEALRSPEAARARAALMRRILEDSVRVSRRAAAEVFAGERLHRDIRDAALRARRARDARVVEVEERRVGILASLRNAVTNAFAGLRASPQTHPAE